MNSKGTLQFKNRKLIDCVWFMVDNELVGMTLSLDTSTNKLKGEVGKGLGQTEAEDAISIMIHGSPIPVHLVMRYFTDEQVNLNIEDIKHHSDYLLDMVGSPSETILHPSWNHFPKAKIG